MAELLIYGGIVLLAILFFILLSGIRFIPNNRIGIVEKRFSGRGSVKGGFIALQGEAGYQPDVLRGGLHYLMPIQYGVHIDAAGDHPAGQDRLRLRPRRRAAGARRRCWPPTSRPTISRMWTAFLKNGGQRGPQRQILREGTYAINLVQFVVITEEQVYTPAAQPG